MSGLNENDKAVVRGGTPEPALTWRDCWRAMRALTGKDPEVSLALDDVVVEVRGLRRHGPEAPSEGIAVLGVGPTFGAAVLNTWECLIDLPEDDYLVAQRRGVRWGGPNVGFLPATILRAVEKAEAKAKEGPNG